MNMNSNKQQFKKSLICAIKATVQCISSLYEQLIKEQAAVFSGDVGVVGLVVGVPLCFHSRDRNAHKYTTGITMWL